MDGDGRKRGGVGHGTRSLSASSIGVREQREKAGEGGIFALGRLVEGGEEGGRKATQIPSYYNTPPDNILPHGKGGTMSQLFQAFSKDQGKGRGGR